MRITLVCLSLMFGASLQAQEIQLNPGEKLLSVNGVAVNQASPIKIGAGCSGPGCLNRSLENVLPPIVNNLRPTVRGRGGYPPIIGQGTAAYQHALREAQIIASRGGNYHRHSDGGHPLGTAPGATHSGTGYTWDENRPGHCWEDELSPSRIIARAKWRGTNGAWFWSAHYK